MSRLHLPSLICLLVALNACSGTTASKRLDREQSGNTQLQLGVRYLSMDKLKYALKHLQNAQQLIPNNVEVHNALGYLHERLQQPDQALSFYRQALSLEPDNLSALNNLGRFLCGQKSFTEGLETLTQAYHDPMNNRRWITSANIGYCHLDNGDFNQAQSYLQQALQFRPDYAPALLAMQRVHYQHQEYWAAKGFLDRYLAVGKHTPQSLWIAYQCERALGHAKAARNLRQQLINQFPLSSEATELLTQDANH
ncbi:MAG: type IV pilus biogenesis/stability protein PilW [Methylococcales bacterium]|nr:type IV pilus biogenesis/stability protein PilW [Methylococcales bacterium]